MISAHEYPIGFETTLISLLDRECGFELARKILRETQRGARDSFEAQINLPRV